MAVELEIMHTARCTLARSPPGTTVGGCKTQQRVIHKGGAKR